MKCWPRVGGGPSMLVLAPQFGRWRMRESYIDDVAAYGAQGQASEHIALHSCYMIVVRRLTWDSWNVPHIARHGVVPQEVEEVCHGNPEQLQGHSTAHLAGRPNTPRAHACPTRAGPILSRDGPPGQPKGAQLLHHPEERWAYVTKRSHRHRAVSRSFPPFEAEFWDTHDITDYLDELTPVEVRFAKNLSEGLHIRLEPDTLAQLRREAKQKGIGPTTLARMWIMERLQNGSGRA